MENENLFCKIRVLLGKHDQRDNAWDPDKFWAQFEAKKRRRQIEFRLTYTVAATLILVAGYLVLPGDSHSDQSVAFTSRITAIKRPYIDVKSPKMTSKETLAYASAQRQMTNKQPNKPSKIYTSNPAPRLYKGLAIKKLKKASAPENEAFQQSFDNQALADKNIAGSAQERDKIPSLLRMYELVKKERELRSLSVKLEDTDRYTNFQLTVNQYLLENKFNSEAVLLHY